MARGSPMQTLKQAMTQARWLALVMCVVIAGCAEAPPPITEARDIAGDYYRLIQEGRFDEAAGFYAAGDRDRWRQFLQRWQRELGALESVDIHTVETNTTFSGTLYLFIAETGYANGEASEIVTMRTPVNEPGLTIISHEIDPY